MTGSSHVIANLSNQPNVQSYWTPLQSPAPGTAVSEGNVPKAFQPLTIRNVTFANRLWVAPMCQYSYHDGFLTDYTVATLGVYALRGAGLVFVEATGVSPEARISPTDSGLWKDEQIEPMKRVVDVVHGAGQKVGIQLAHAGRKASVYAPTVPNPHGAHVHFNVPESDKDGWEIFAPSAVPFAPEATVPTAMTIPQIKQTVADFVASAKRAVTAGFDVVQIHATHGYLLNEFLSAVSNHRTDEYGGSVENRWRILKEIVTEVKAVLPSHVLLSVRISGSDNVDDARGNTTEKIIEGLKLVVPLGVDQLDVSSGGLLPGIMRRSEALFNADYAYEIKKAFPDLSVSTAGGVSKKEHVDKALETLDSVCVARAFMANPNWVLDLADQYEGLQVRWPLQSGYALGRL